MSLLPTPREQHGQTSGDITRDEWCSITWLRSSRIIRRVSSRFHSRLTASPYPGTSLRSRSSGQCLSSQFSPRIPKRGLSTLYSRTDAPPCLSSTPMRGFWFTKGRSNHALQATAAPLLTFDARWFIVCLFCAQASPSAAVPELGRSGQCAREPSHALHLFLAFGSRW